MGINASALIQAIVPTRAKVGKPYTHLLEYEAYVELFCMCVQFVLTRDSVAYIFSLIRGQCADIGQNTRVSVRVLFWQKVPF